MRLRRSTELGLCDLHLHILPNIDDGARDVTASVEILEGLFDLGYRHFVATPHAPSRRRWRYDRALIQTRFEELVEAVEASGLPIDLGCGAEYTYGEGFRMDIDGQNAMTIDDSKYVLMELPEDYIPSTMPMTLFSISTQGYYPILAHPERCAPYHQDPSALEELASGRALIQVSFRSLAGTFGRRIKKAAWTLVESGAADLVATDCHSPRELKKVIRPVVKSLSKRVSKARLDVLMGQLPRRMIGVE
ncbi:MAG: CpsB/CapC family capsule biosynthesis tyrosine phosphatase [Myxococcota bacterium]|nr:CpsB/CapC family capsule biosynthesis tyrosine phosphatase [Myxococcota bacterium]